jgi:DNA-binding CsgD family transcriptional regulator
MDRKFSKLPWTLIYDYLYEIGSELDRDTFGRKVLEKLDFLVPEATSFISFYLPTPSVPLIREAIGITAKEVDVYNQYYWTLNPQREAEFTVVTQTHWRDYRHTEFVTDYMTAIDIGHTMGMVIPSGTTPLCISASRPRRGSPFRPRVQRIFELIQPHLTNYYNILLKMDQLAKKQAYMELVNDCKSLSKRETEVAVLLCQKLTMLEIATKLMLSPRTVQTHIEHIKEKLGVRTRRELILKLTGTANSKI